MTTQFVTPVGRLVQGDVFTGNTKDNKGQPLTVKTGPNKGQPTTRFFVCIALPKTNAAFKNFWEDSGPVDANYPQGAYRAFFDTLYNEGRTGFPALFNNPQGLCTHPRFAWKVADGDGIDADGKPNASKPGCAGHWLVKFSSQFAPKVLKNGAYINDPSAVPRGHYIRIAGNMQPNVGTSDVPGIYLNHEAVEYIAYGEEIRSGIDAIGAFAGAAMPVALPPGASLAPPTPAGNSGLPGAPGAAAPLAPPPGAPAPQQYAAGTPPAPQQYAQPPAPAAAPQYVPSPAPAQQQYAAPQPPAAPNHQFVQNAAGTPPAPQQYAQPPAPPAAPQPPAAPAYVPTAAAQGMTMEQWQASGWSIDQLLQNNIFVRQ